jgi:hypothetical protein
MTASCRCAVSQRQRRILFDAGVTRDGLIRALGRPSPVADQRTLAGGRLPALGSGAMAAWVRLVQPAASMVASIARMSS